jgi:hypothetical protein
MNAELVYQGEVPNETGLPGRSSERSPELGDPRNSKTAKEPTSEATARDPCDGMRWDATNAMECDVTKNQKLKTKN